MENFYYKQIELEMNKENINHEVLSENSEPEEDVEHFKRNVKSNCNESKFRSSIRKLKTKLNKKINNENLHIKPSGGLVNEAFKSSASNVKDRLNAYQEPLGPNLVKSPFKNLDANQLRIVSKKFGENPFKSPPPPTPASIAKYQTARRNAELDEVRSKSKVNFTKSNFKPYVKPKSPKPVLRDLRNRDFKKLNRNVNRDPWSTENVKNEVKKAVKYEIPTISDELLKNVKAARIAQQDLFMIPSKLYESCHDTNHVDPTFACKNHKSFELNISEIDSQISDLERFRDQLIKWNKNYDSRDDLSINYIPDDGEEFKIARAKSGGPDENLNQEKTNAPESPTDFAYMDEIVNIEKHLTDDPDIVKKSDDLSSRGSPDGADVNRTYTLPLDLDNIDINSNINIDDIDEIPNIDNCETELEEAKDYFNENERKYYSLESVNKENACSRVTDETDEVTEEQDFVPSSTEYVNNISPSSNKTEMFKHIDIYRKPITILDPIIESPMKANPSQTHRRSRTDCYFKTINRSNAEKYAPEKMFEIKKPVHYNTPEDMFSVKDNISHDLKSNKTSLKRKRCSTGKRTVGIVNPSFNVADQPPGSDNETFYMNESIGNENKSFEGCEKVDNPIPPTPERRSSKAPTVNTNDDNFPIQLESRGNHKNLESYLGLDADTDVTHNTVEINYLPEGGIVNPNFDMNDPQNFKRNVRFNDSICILNDNSNIKKNKNKILVLPNIPNSQVPLKSNLKHKPENQPFCGINRDKREPINTLPRVENPIAHPTPEECNILTPDASNSEFFVINTTNPFFSDILKQENARTSTHSIKLAVQSKDMNRISTDEELKSKHLMLSSVERDRNAIRKNVSSELDSTYTVDDSTTNALQNNKALRINTKLSASCLSDLSDSLSPDTLKHVCLPLTYVPQSATSHKIFTNQEENSSMKIYDVASGPVLHSTRTNSINRKDNHYFLSIDQDQNFYPSKKVNIYLTHKDLDNKKHFLDKQHNENFYKEKKSEETSKENDLLSKSTEKIHCNPVKSVNNGVNVINNEEIEYEKFENFLKTNQSIESSTHSADSFVDDTPIKHTNQSKTFRSSTTDLPHYKSDENLLTVGLKTERKNFKRKTLKRSSTQNNCKMNKTGVNLAHNIISSEKSLLNKENKTLRRTKSLNERSTRQSLNRITRSNSTGQTLRKTNSCSNQTRLTMLSNKLKLDDKRIQHKQSWKQYERRQFDNFDINSIKVFKDFEEAIDFEYIPVTSFYTNKNDTTEYDVSHIVEKYESVDCKQCQQKQTLMSESESSNKTISRKQTKQSQTNRGEKKKTISKVSQRSKKGLQLGKYNFMKLKYPSYKVKKARLNVSHNTTLQNRGSNKTRRSLRRLLNKYTNGSEQETVSSFNLSQNRFSSPVGKYKAVNDSFIHESNLKSTSYKMIEGNKSDRSPSSFQSETLGKQRTYSPNTDASCTKSTENSPGLSKRNPCSKVKNCDFLGDHTCDKIESTQTSSESVSSATSQAESVGIGEKQIDRLSILINELRRHSYRGKHGRNHLWTPRYQDRDDTCQSQTKEVVCENVEHIEAEHTSRHPTRTPSSCQLRKSNSLEKIAHLDAKLELKFKSTREKDHLNCSIIFLENPVYERRVRSEENVNAKPQDEIRKEKENYAKKSDKTGKPRVSLGFEIERREETGGGRGGGGGGGRVGGGGEARVGAQETDGSGDNIITISNSKEKRAKRTESSSSDGGGEKGEAMEVVEGRQPPHRRKKMRHQIDIHLHALFAAVEHGQVDKTRTILESADVNVNSMNSDGFTPLDVAILSNNLPLVKLLISFGAQEGNKFPSPDKLGAHLRHLLHEAERRVLELGGGLLLDPAPSHHHSTLSINRGSFSVADSDRSDKTLALWERRCKGLKKMLLGFDQARPPDAPSCVSVEVTGNTSVSVKYQEPDHSSSHLCSKFRVEWSTDPEFQLLTGAREVLDSKLHEVEISSLSHGQRYYFRVCCGNIRGYGAPRHSLPEFLEPSSWRDCSCLKTTERISSDGLALLDRLFGEMKNERPDLKALNEAEENGGGDCGKRKKTTIKQLFTAASKFQKHLKRGVFLSCLLYHEDKVLVTNEDFLPVIEIDDTYPNSIYQDFHWLLKVSCTWEDIKLLRNEMEKSLSNSNTSNHFRVKLLNASLQMQTALSIENLGQLYHRPIKDSEGTLVIPLINYVKNVKSISVLNSRWLPLTKLVKRTNNLCNISENNVSDMLMASVQDQITYHQVSRIKLSKGLYLGYLKMRSSVDLLQVLVPSKSPNVPPHCKIRDNPHVTADEWDALRSCNSSDKLNSLSEHQRMFLEHAALTMKRLFRYMEVSDEDCALHRLYDSEVIEISPEVSLVMIVPPADSACSVPGQRELLLQRPDLLPLPVQVFEMVHLGTYQRSLVSKYSRLSCILQLDTALAQQGHREAFSNTEVSLAKERLSRLEALQSRLNTTWKQTRWLLDVLSFARDRMGPQCPASVKYLLSLYNSCSEATSNSSCFLQPPDCKSVKSRGSWPGPGVGRLLSSVSPELSRSEQQLSVVAPPPPLPPRPCAPPAAPAPTSFPTPAAIPSIELAGPTTTKLAPSRSDDVLIQHTQAPPTGTTRSSSATTSPLLTARLPGYNTTPPTVNISSSLQSLSSDDSSLAPTIGEELPTPTPGIIQVYAAYNTGLAPGTSLMLHVSPRTCAREVVDLVVKEVNMAVLVKGKPGPIYPSSELSNFCLVAVLGPRERCLRDDFKPLQLQNPWRQGRLYVRQKHDTLAALDQSSRHSTFL